MIECRLLGPVTLTCDGAPPPPELLWKKNLALFLYLALSPRGRRSRDHLVGLLWGDKEESAARHSLREAVRVVRKAVGEGALTTEGDQVALDPSAVDLDTVLLEARMIAGDREGAARLIHGELAEGFGVPDASGFEEWLAAERVQWGRRCREVLVGAGEQRLARGDELGALALGEQALRSDARSEPALRLVLRASAIRGEVGPALAAFAQAGGGLSGELAALAERIRAGHRVSGAPMERPGQAAVRRAPLVSAGGTLQRMVELWEAVRGGRGGRVILLSAPPGYGKTRLSTELAARAELDGAGIAAIRAVPGDRERSLGGITGLLRGGMLAFAGAATARPEALAALAAEVPEWGERFSAAVRGMTPIALADAFLEVLRASAAEAPLMLLIDDADSLDPASFALLEGLVRELPTLPILLILASSGAPAGLSLDPIGTRVGRDVEGASLTLAPLDDASLEALARGILPKSTDEQIARVVRRVAVDSAGIPLLAVELLTAIAAGLEVAGAPTAWPATHRTLDQTRPGELPELLIAAIRVGFRVLSRDAQAALAAAAVLGDRVDGARIGRGAQLADPSAALDELEWTRWLVAEGRGYAFVARIVREVVLRDLVTAGQIQRIKDAAGPDKE